MAAINFAARHVIDWRVADENEPHQSEEEVDPTCAKVWFGCRHWQMTLPYCSSSLFDQVNSLAMYALIKH